MFRQCFFNLNNSIPPVGLSFGDVKVAHKIPLNYDLTHCFCEEWLTFLFNCENVVIKGGKENGPKNSGQILFKFAQRFHILIILWVDIIPPGARIPQDDFCLYKAEAIEYL